MIDFFPSGFDETKPPPGYEVHTFSDGRRDPNVVSLLGTGGPAMTLALAWQIFKRDAAPLVAAATAALREELKVMTEQRDRAWATIGRLTAEKDSST